VIVAFVALCIKLIMRRFISLNLTKHPLSIIMIVAFLSRSDGVRAIIVIVALSAAGKLLNICLTIVKKPAAYYFGCYYFG